MQPVRQSPQDYSSSRKYPQYMQRHRQVFWLVSSAQPSRSEKQWQNRKVRNSVETHSYGYSPRLSQGSLFIPDAAHGIAGNLCRFKVINNRRISKFFSDKVINTEITIPQNRTRSGIQARKKRYNKFLYRHKQNLMPPAATTNTGAILIYKYNSKIPIRHFTMLNPWL